MGSQLFYTYQSTNGYDTESESAIVGNSAYTYSLVFDTNRKTIWAQDEEYGIPRITKNDTYDIEYIRDHGIKMITYHGASSYMYVTRQGAVTLYNGCSLLSFNAYDNSENALISYGVDPLTNITMDSYEFRAHAFGSEIDTARLECTLYNGSALVSLINYEFGLNNVMDEDQNWWFTYRAPSSPVISTGPMTMGSYITASMTVIDTIGNQDSKEIVIFRVKSLMWYGVQSWDGNINHLPNQTDIVNERFWSREIEPTIEDVIPSTNNDDYFWMFIPNIFSVRMEQGGGDADMEVYENITVFGVQCNLYRTPRTNVGGARYKLEIS